MNEITPEQAKQLKTWASERDSILSELSVLKTEKEKLIKTNKELSQSNTEIQNSIVECTGRMIELDKEEELYKEIVSVEIPKLEIEKTTLETEIMGFQKEVSYLDLKKEGLKKDIEFLIKTQKEVYERTGVLEKIVEHVTNVSSNNTKVIEDLVLSLKEKIQEILELSSEDLFAHKKVLDEIPKLFVELQRKVLARDELRKVK